eukprot:SAG22_NODE_335_length_12071_cov_5.268771_10_plen_167_part_00
MPRTPGGSEQRPSAAVVAEIASAQAAAEFEYRPPRSRPPPVSTGQESGEGDAAAEALRQSAPLSGRQGGGQRQPHRQGLYPSWAARPVGRRIASGFDKSRYPGPALWPGQIGYRDGDQPGAAAPPPPPAAAVGSGGGGAQAPRDAPPDAVVAVAGHFQPSGAVTAR